METLVAAENFFLSEYVKKLNGELLHITAGDWYKDNYIGQVVRNIPRGEKIEYDDLAGSEDIYSKKTKDNFEVSDEPIFGAPCVYDTREEILKTRWINGYSNRRMKK